MPLGPTHRKLTYGLLTVSTTLICLDPLLGTAFCLGVLATRDINPDLDLHVPFYLKFLGYDLYKEAIQHRRGLRGKDWRLSKLNVAEMLLYSHLPYLGTILRFLPLLILWLTLAYAIGTLSPTLVFLIALAFFNGMGASDTIHVLADISVSEVHRRF